MLHYVLRRVALMVATLLIVVTAVFGLLRVVPGGPFDQSIAVSPTIEANLRAKYQLDAPLTQQYFDYIAGLLQGDLGPSYSSRDFTVSELIESGLPVSLTVGSLALVIALGLGTLSGFLAAHLDGRWPSSLIRIFNTSGLSMPPLVAGPILILIFAVWLQILPAGGLGSWQHYVLPVLTLAIPFAAACSRLLRASFVEIKVEPYVLTAKSKGVSKLRLSIRHMLKPASLPLLTFTGPMTAALLGGSIVIEELFALPGLGRYLVTAAIEQDYPLVLGAVIVYAVIIMAANLLVDLIYPMVDARLRHTRTKNVG